TSYAAPHKGKTLDRSWPQLPEEIVRLITTYLLWDLSTLGYCPQTWEHRRYWCSRMMYACVRDALEIEKSVMSVCPEWKQAVETHLFWNHAINVIDPNDTFLHHMVKHPETPLNASSNTPQAPTYVIPYHHFRGILSNSCLVCRVNYPLTSVGLGCRKRQIPNMHLGSVLLCQDHDRRSTHLCWVCLKDSPILHPQDTSSREWEMAQALGITENEDEETWPKFESTCRKCRAEWLWRRISLNPRDVEAVGNSSFDNADWETKQAMETFIELGEGSISDVIVLSREKVWLRRNTKYDSLGQHLLAAHRTEPRSDLREEEEEEEDSEEDRELMLMRGSTQVRDLALQDWCRHRILDGHWYSPYDTHFRYTMPGYSMVVPTVHPCPWARELDGEAGDPTSGVDVPHPLQSTVNGEGPPSHVMAHQVYVVHKKQMREILLPALRNIIRKIVMECSVYNEEHGGYADPAKKVESLDIEDVVKFLREEEGVWYDGVDWLERRRNEEEANATRRREMELREPNPTRKEDDSDSTTSSSSGHDSAKSSSESHRGSGSSIGTSPVLSTTTLQTTPSPPPTLIDDLPNTTSKSKSYFLSAPRLIPIDPIRSTPRLLSKIPYLAELNARAAANGYTGVLSPSIALSQPAQPTLRTTLYPPSVRGEIELKEIHDLDAEGEGEEEVDYDASDFEYDEDEEDEEDYDDDDDDDGREAPYTIISYSVDSPPSVPQRLSPEPRARPRKRPSDELLDEDYDEELGRYEPFVKYEELAQLSPLQRQSEPKSPGRHRKRNSEELDDADAEVHGSPHHKGKRVR
ncbi:hypothetical protein CPB84DRAFT_1657466, partial [Gymnopilus junonius]